MLGNGASASVATRGIWVVGATGLKIVGNLIQNNRGMGIQLAEGARNVLVTGNVITGTLAKATPRKYGGGEAILLYQAEGNTIRGNVMKGNQGGTIKDLAPTAPNWIEDK